jgi:hypothetical protein
MILALVFVTIFGMTMAATLGYADTAFRTNQVTQQRQATLYNANGALDTAIQAMRPVLDWGREGLACAGVNVTVAGGATASVDCTPQSGSGAGSPITTTDVSANAPSHALVTTSRRSEPGLNFRSGTLPVTGPVVVSSSIATVAGGPNGQLNATGFEVKSGETCTTAHILSSSTNCPTPVGSDIATALARVGVPSWTTTGDRTTPACPGTNRYLSLSPGRYTDATALTALTGGTCNGLVLHLLPGNYHFDFSQRGFAAQWRITDPTVTVVAGTANGWTPPAPGASAPSVPTSGACSPSSAGSLLTFSSESALYVGGSRNVELCGVTQANGQVVSILGPWSAMGLPEAQLQRRCVALPRGCPFIMVTSAGVAQNGVLRVHGTVLAPTASIGVDVRGGAVAQFNRGTIARSVYTWGSQTVGPVFSTGFDGGTGGYANRLVVLVVTLEGQRVGRAKVEFEDGLGADPGTSVTVLEWSTAL